METQRQDLKLCIMFYLRVCACVCVCVCACVCVCVQVHPQVEEYWGHVNPIGPRACYDEGKRVAETMAYAYAKQVQR